MKNFLRALRHAWPYRRRLAVSVGCAVCAAALWGLVFTSIYPVLQVLVRGENAATWLDKKIMDTSPDHPGLKKQISDLEKDLKRDTEREGNLNEQLEVEREPGIRKELEKEAQALNDEQRRTTGKLESARRWLNLYQVAQRHVHHLPTDPFRTMALVIGLVVGCIAVKCVFEFGQESLVGSVVNLSLFDLRNRFYRNVIHLDIDQFGEPGTGEMMARFTNDMESLGTGVKTLFGKVVAEPLRALACVVGASIICWQLTLLFLILVPVAALILGRVGRMMKHATRRLLERMSNIYKILQESFQGIRVVKAFTMEPYERRRFCAATKDYYHKSMLVVNIDALADPIIEVLGVVAVAGALLLGSYLVLYRETGLLGIKLATTQLEPEAMLNLFTLLFAVADPVRKLSSVFTRLQSGAAAADRIFDFLDRRPRVQANSDGPRIARRPKPGAAKPADPYIEFRDVCFSYRPGEPTLTNIHLSVRHGETVAVVGHNGSGKTTLLSLLPRFYDPDHGTVFLDGHDLRTVHLRSLRQQIGLVTQDAVLFDDTVYNNIAYGSRGASAEQVEAAAKRAMAHDFITRKPGGYQFRVGEVGQALSGGERQRIALARAILRDPAVLILDEFTSQSDQESEAAIHRALAEFKVGRTVFVIAHRLHTLQIADRVVILEGGRISGFGTHAELLATCPAYVRLHEAQAQRRVA